jgi:hypothetical protein
LASGEAEIFDTGGEKLKRLALTVIANFKKVTFLKFHFLSE